ncbi:NADP oxidoreductase [Streptomyces inusitatus]|uniref:NADP oxidoreductase n=1 Tax=Streptomyces inusitatus TaxID=68221 RepID=A0A918Q0Z5_9ACTN|nr:NAD(P)-binding domain-containing protein [Streptomyces inusitatus]GGZ28045.1 NADP oxidoreductase [Streptomyces inusitatus]
MTQTIGIVGAGQVARALALPLSAAGHRVIVGARRPDAAGDWGPGVRVTRPEEAAEAADLVINALPGAVSAEVLGPLAPRLAGKVLIDVANAVVPDAHGFASALRYPGSSLAEELQRTLPGVRGVKTLNTVHVSVMAVPSSLGVPPSAFLSGDDGDAKRAAEALLISLGWPPAWILDLGGVASARGPESFVLMVGGLVRALGPVPFGLAVAR